MPDTAGSARKPKKCSTTTSNPNPNPNRKKWLKHEKEMTNMVSWWWLIPVFLIGSCIGSILMGLCCANGQREHEEESWVNWEEEDYNDSV